MHATGGELECVPALLRLPDQQLNLLLEAMNEVKPSHHSSITAWATFVINPTAASVSDCM
jgi:hypothetical protein